MKDIEYKRLDEKVINVKTLEGFVTLGVFAVMLLAIIYCTNVFGWPRWIVILSACLVVASIPFELYLLPKWRYQLWRYSISETSIQIRTGILFKRNILIPMGKVQHVAAKQGPILKKYNLYTITLSTAAGSHEIFGLAEDKADIIRKDIEVYAGLNDEQV
ncbi:PH domain-containing protein [Metabacillus niabensis]|uniref:Membrane protein YdbS with pleckstrin-like domain n=1 Tax=Metabacillus niabensis TaxID=324854 RepID=A0ABT9Z5Z9_9BACI|nr:PH domain-containing protein [Metabacillus niabensis]MDQ0227669.1 membrane protein YdbS with pleckstrin-like domain [Metabacillus niabensis]